MMYNTFSSKHQTESSYSPTSSLSLPQEFEKKLNFDESLEKMRDEGNVQRCPWCGVYIEKNGGCNIIKCNSEICKKSNIFCYLCGEKLFKNNKLDHFIGKDSNANLCYGLKYSKGAAKSSDFVIIDESEKNMELDEFSFGDYDLNKFLDIFGLKSCPKCFSKKDLVLEMKWPLFFKCSNIGCSLSFLTCLICNKMLKSCEITSHLQAEGNLYNKNIYKRCIPEII